jgi:FkbM family methyltransferase
LFGNPAWRKRPIATAARFLTGLARKYLGLRYVTLPYDGGRSRLRVDLRSRFGFLTYAYGVDDPDLALVGSLLAPGDIFIDGGAHVGMFTLVAAARVGPAGRVLAFEPAPAARAQLLQNLALSRFPWVEVSPMALAECPGARHFVAFSNDAWGSSSFAPPPELAGGHAEPVETTTLAAAIADLDPARIRLVKLDLEGAEYAALQGAKQLLRDVQPDFLVELEPQHLARQGSSVAEVVGLFESYGYCFFTVDEQGKAGVRLTPAAHPGQGGARPNLFVSRDLERLARAPITLEKGSASRK